MNAHQHLPNRPDHAPLIARWLAEGGAVDAPMIPQITAAYPEATLAELQRGFLIACDLLSYEEAAR